jgi:cbb3-type cytochrome oxidase maturation protein
MSVLYLLIIAALTVAIGFLIAFIWAVKSGQFDDTHTPSMRILLDEERVTSSNKIKKEEEENGN